MINDCSCVIVGHLPTFPNFLSLKYKETLHTVFLGVTYILGTFTKGQNKIYIFKI